MKIFKIVFLAISLVAVSGNAVAAKVDICHKGEETINVSTMALKAHLRHGDVEGACIVAEKVPVVIIFRCDRDGAVTPVSTTTDMPVDAQNILQVVDDQEPLGCADTILAFAQIGLHLMHVNTGPVGATMTGDEVEIDENRDPALDVFGDPVFVEESEQDFATEYLFKGALEVVVD